MKTRLRMYCVSCLVTLGAVQLSAQTYHWIHSSENDTWQQSTVRLKSEVNTLPDVSVDGKAKIATFKTWGVTFNELCWDALGVLTREEQDEILKKVFAPDGDLRIGRGRISLGANDYARSWYSCDEVEGDFELRYFNIDRDKQAIIPFIRAAQTRYLRTYANYFCKFIDAYKAEGIPIDMVMYQNEAYSYTPYPGCAWTAEGTILFNRDYLAPALKKAHPEVKLYLGTLNTSGSHPAAASRLELHLFRE